MEQGNQARIKTGQCVIQTTGVAVCITGSGAPSVHLANGLHIKAKSTNAASGTVGDVNVTNVIDGTGNGYIVDPGEAGALAVANANLVYVNGTAGDIWSWEAN